MKKNSHKLLLKNNLIIQTGENLIELSKIIPKIKIKKGDYLQ
jgi:hypothetical protein